MYAGTTHDLNIFSVLITTAASTIIGRMVGYFIGWGFHWLLIRYGGYIRMTEARIKLGQYLFLEAAKLLWWLNLCQSCALSPVSSLA